MSANSVAHAAAKKTRRQRAAERPAAEASFAVHGWYPVSRDRTLVAPRMTVRVFNGQTSYGWISGISKSEGDHPGYNPVAWERMHDKAFWRVYLYMLKGGLL